MLARTVDGGGSGKLRSGLGLVAVWEGGAGLGPEVELAAEACRGQDRYQMRGDECLPPGEVDENVFARSDVGEGRDFAVGWEVVCHYRPTGRSAPSRPILPPALEARPASGPETSAGRVRGNLRIEEARLVGRGEVASESRDVSRRRWHSRASASPASAVRRGARWLGSPALERRWAGCRVGIQTL